MKYVMGVIHVNGHGSMPLDDNMRPTVFVRGFDVSAYDGRGHVEYTTHLAEAMQFDTVEELSAAWTSVPPNRPLRDDGEPNKPLTAITIELVKVQEVPA